MTIQNQKTEYSRRNRVLKFMIKPNFQLGYVLGTLNGDGTIGYSQSSLGVTDLDFMNYFKKQLQKIYPYKISQCKRDRGGKRKLIYAIYFYSKDYCKFLKEYNLKSIPFESENFKRGFLKGFYDSEGSVRASNLDNKKIAKREISFTQKSFETIKLISVLLKQFNISHKINSRIGSGFNKIGKYYSIEIYGFNNLLIFKKKIGFSIHRKERILDIAINSFEIEGLCVDCNKKIKLSGPRMIRCKECAKTHFIDYHKEYRENKRILKLKKRNIFCVDCGENIFDKLMKKSDYRIKRCDKCQQKENRRKLNKYKKLKIGLSKFKND